MSSTRLSVYNEALTHLGSRTLSGLSENRESRRVLDTYWNAGIVRRCLKLGQWNFAIRSQRVEYEADIVPEFGYTHAFAKPSDWVRTVAVTTDEFFRAALHEYEDERGYWWSDENELFVRFVSDDAQYGGDLSLWADHFASYVGYELAYLSCKKITGADPDAILRRGRKDSLGIARSNDAMDNATKFKQPGAWTRARAYGGRFTGRRYLRG